MMKENDFIHFDLNFYQSCFMTCQHIKKGQAVETEDKVITSCGLSIPFFNTIFIKPPESYSFHDWNKDTKTFADKKLRYQLLIPDYAEQPDNELLAKHQLNFDEKLPAMVFDSHQSTLSAPPIYDQLVIKTVVDQQTFEDFRAIAGPAFDMPDFVGERILTKAFVLENRVNSFVGYLSGKPVSTSMLFVSEGVAGIYWVATETSMRKQGLGEALTYHASQEGLKSVERYCVLQASKAGESVYQKMGYQTIYHYNKYLCVND